MYIFRFERSPSFSVSVSDAFSVSTLSLFVSRWIIFPMVFKYGFCVLPPAVVHSFVQQVESPSEETDELAYPRDSLWVTQVS